MHALQYIRNSTLSDVNQVWFTDYASAAGEITRLCEWWNQINTIVSKFGYFTNSTKTWLVTKENCVSKAAATFADTGVKVTSEGRPYLGAALGTDDYSHTFAASKVQQWSKELESLATIAHSQPHAAHAAFTYAMMSKWTYLTRTAPDISHLLQPLEPKQATDAEFQASTRITKPLKETILEQKFEYTEDVVADQIQAKIDVHKLKRQQARQTTEILTETLPLSLKRSMDLAQEKGASNWLTSLPIDEFGFALHKGAFQDAIALHYNWQPQRTPSTCGCGTRFSIEHSLSCPKGGFPSIRHNEIRDLTANLLSEVCSDVCIEPDLQPLTGEVLTGASSNIQDGARLDITANGFWGGRFERTYFDVRVFNPHAPSHRQSSLSTCYRRQESLKKRAYATGGMADEATVFYKRLASCLAVKWDYPYSSTMSWLRCRLTFSLLHSAIQCIRGARSSCGHAIKSPPPIDLATSELNLI